MSEYYFLWMKSEAAKNAILPLVTGLILAQIISYYLIDQMLPQLWQSKAKIIYQIMVIIFDLIAGLLVWGEIR